MDWIVVEGVRPWDGRYEFDLETHPLTAREWGWIKRFSGYLPLTIDKGLEGADPELFAAWAVIAVRRAGRVQPGEVQDLYDRLADAPFGAAITYEIGDLDGEEVDAGPPPGSSDGSRSTSGAGSTPSSAPSTEDGSGIRGSAISESDPVRLAS